MGKLQSAVRNAIDWFEYNGVKLNPNISHILVSCMNEFAKSVVQIRGSNPWVQIRGFKSAGSNPRVQIRGFKSAGSNPRVQIRGFKSAGSNPRVQIRGFKSAGSNPRVQIRGFKSAGSNPRVQIRGFKSVGIYVMWLYFIPRKRKHKEYKYTH